MKPTESKKKLQINKKTIATLTAADKGNLVGGLQQGAITTSLFYCSDFTCCQPTTTVDTILTGTLF